MVILLLFLIILDVGIVSGMRKLLIERTNKHLQDELGLLSQVTTESLLRHDYANLQFYLENWVKEDNDFSAVKAVTPNGFILVEYNKAITKSMNFFSIKKDVTYENQYLVTLELTGNYSEVEKIISNLNRLLMLASTLFMTIMGVVLWYSQKRVVLIPMEKEIARRKEAEEKLKAARDELEVKVDERTSELKTELMVRHLAEEALRDSEEQVRLLLSATAEAIYGVDTNGTCTFCNPATIKILGYEREEALLGKNMHELIHHSRADGSEYPIEECKVYESFTLSKEAHVDNEVFWRKDGSSFYVEYWAHPVTKEGRIVGAVVNFFDITQRKQAEEALLDSWEKYRRLFESANDSIFIIDPSTGHILDGNENAARRLGYTRDELLRLNIDDIDPYMSSDRKKEIISELSGKGTVLYEHVNKRKDGTEMPVEISGQVVAFGKREVYQMFVRDITERKKLEGELIKTEKLDSLGVLAGGLAHDLNNLLTGILGNISLAKMYLKSPEKARKKLEEAEKAAFRTRDLNLQLLTFSKGGTPIMMATSIRNLLMESANFALSGSNVRCHYDIPNDLWTVDVDEGQMNQVVSNIIINADQAMPGGGKIVVKCENIFVTEEDIIPLAEGRYVKISIHDAGAGIPEDQVTKIFDPYFTTKQKGSGLGLASAFSIVRKHNGYINVESELGSGTTFTIYLPASQEKIGAGDKEDESCIEGEGKILVMDDEVLVREVAGDMLTGLGYRVEFAKDGKEAIDVYKRAKGSEEPFDAVIMDLTVPGGMGGEEAIRELRGIDPEIKAIVSSGYSTDPIMSEYKKYGFSGVVVKPYKVQDLSKTLHDVIMENKPA